MSDRSNIYVVSIVAIVAVVGLVTLFMNTGSDSAPTNEENVAGQAFYSGSYVMPSYDDEVAIPGWVKEDSQDSVTIPDWVK